MKYLSIKKHKVIAIPGIRENYWHEFWIAKRKSAGIELPAITMNLSGQRREEGCQLG
jgi:hypothetical protein